MRQIACDTADRGEPASIFSDREVLADALTRYYTDSEPQSLWVAESEGRVIGYLAGCFDDERYQRLMAWRVVPAALARAIARGALGRRETWRLLVAMVRTWRSGGFPPRVPLEHYPAHLHINIRQGFRGQQIGQQLIARFVEQVQAAGLSGVRAGVHEDNLPARRFFERMGFTVLGRQPVTLPDGDTYRTHYMITFGRRVIH